MLALRVFGATGKMGKRVLELATLDPEFILSEDVFDVAIDFSSPDATAKHLKIALDARKPLVLGTTGHSREQIQEIERCAQTIPLLYSPNFSFGIALFLEIAAFLKKNLDTSALAICETHHIHKKDSPSGTALALAQSLGTDPVNIQSIRSEEVIGEHEVSIELGNERLFIKHTAHSRDAFAQGALRAAKFLVAQPPGLYSLKNLFQP